MQLQGLGLQNFRCHAFWYRDFEERGAAFWGPNGVGKTSLLEAIAKVAILRGFGTDAQMIRWGARAYRLKVRLAGERPGLLELSYEQRQGTILLWEGALVQPLRVWIGRLPLVVLRPGDTAWIEGGGAIRRQWADRLLSQLFPDYLEALARYQRTVEQRNALLVADPTASLEPWDRLLLQTGPLLQQKRLWLASVLAPMVQAIFAQADPDKSISLSYKLSTESPDSLSWEAGLRQVQAQERRRGRTLIGPHTEDFQLKLGPFPAKGYASEGQKKWLLIALRWAELRLLAEQKKQLPIVLLDDLGEKLDAQHLEAVAQLTQEAVQTFVTDVDKGRLQKLFPQLPIVPVP